MTWLNSSGGGGLVPGRMGGRLPNRYSAPLSRTAIRRGTSTGQPVQRISNRLLIRVNPPMDCDSSRVKKSGSSGPIRKRAFDGLLTGKVRKVSTWAVSGPQEQN